MKLSPASLLILTMFCSFAVVLAAMILLFRPGSRPVRQRVDRIQAPETPPARQMAGADTSARVSPPPQTPDTGHVVSGKTVVSSLPSSQGADSILVQKTPATPRTPASGSRLQRRLEQEQKEMKLLKAEMEKRLKTQLAAREKKLAQLATTCAKLEPGEAVQILQTLEDDMIAEVVRRLSQDAARQICSLLQRLGREKAIPSQYRQAKPE